jgi:hypothetical protein
MTTPNPITPPPELVQQWCEQLFGCPDEPEINAYELARLAAQHGADQELEACCGALDELNDGFWSEKLRAARRPKPPSLKEQAFGALGRFNANAHTRADEMIQDFETIRRALEELPE